MMNARWKIAQYFELRWWQRYWRDKDGEAYYAWKKAYWNKFLQDCGLETPEAVNVLDAGCGPAGIFIALERCPVDAVDPLLTRYTKNLPHFNPTDYPWVHFSNLALEDLQATDKKYRYVFCLNAINHVADIEKSMDNLAAALAPGGTLVLSIDAHCFTWLKWIFRLIPGDILHPHQHSLADYSRMLARRNLTIARTPMIQNGYIFRYYALVAVAN